MQQPLQPLTFEPPFDEIVRRLRAPLEPKPFSWNPFPLPLQEKTQSVAERIEEFGRKLMPTEEQLEYAKFWVEEIRKVVDRLPCVEKTLFSGSYARGTAISPLHDVDILVLLKNTTQQDKDQYRELLLQALKESGSFNPRTGLFLDKFKLRVQGCSIGLYTDNPITAPDVCSFDLVPCRLVSETATTLTIDKKGKITTTDPMGYKSDLTQTRGKWAQGKLSQLIRLAKQWKEENQKPLKSYCIEKHCQKFAETEAEPDDIREAFAQFFGYLSKMNEKELSFNNTFEIKDHTKAKARIATAAENSSEAVFYEKTDPEKAHKLWKEIFKAY